MKWFAHIGLIGLLFLASCEKLDSVAYPGDNTITEYLLDDYPNATGFVLPEEYDLPSFAVNFITIESQLESEEEPVLIQAIYIGTVGNIPNDTIIVYCHGQADHMDRYWQRAKLMAHTGWKNRFGVLMMDYRGYGLSEGTTTEEALYEDVASCLDWLKDQGADTNNVFMYGYSLGAVPATWTCAYYDHFKPKGLILEAPMASVSHLAEESTIINFDPSFVSTLQFNVAEMIVDVDQPLMWLHGVEDGYVSISNGEVVYENHQGEYKEAHRVEGAGHDAEGIQEAMGFDVFLKTLEDFLTR